MYCQAACSHQETTLSFSPRPSLSFMPRVSRNISFNAPSLRQASSAAAVSMAGVALTLGTQSSLGSPQTSARSTNCGRRRLCPRVALHTHGS